MFPRREKILRKVNGRLADDAHRLVPLAYTFLQDIEERNLYGDRVTDEGEQYHELRVFSILPTKRGFECSHIKMCQLGLWGLQKHAGYTIPNRGSGWEEVRDQYWRMLFNIKKFETANRKFAGEIVTDGKVVFIIMRKPKPEVEATKKYSEDDFDAFWGLDPGRRDMFVATNQWDEPVSCSFKEFYEVFVTRK